MRSIGIGSSQRKPAHNPVVRVMNNGMCDIDILKGARVPSGAGSNRTIGNFGQSVGQAVAWIATNFSEISQWVGHLFQMGQSYTTENGGEVARQMGPNLGQPWCNAYMDWIKTYRPELWQTGDIWDAPDYAHPSRWHDIYVQYVAAGMPDGTKLDAQMIPVGMTQVVAAVEATNNVTTTPTETAPTAAQLQALQIIAMQLAGMGTAADQATAAATYAQLPITWKAYVDQLVAVWQQSDAVDTGSGGGAGPTSEKQGGSALVLAAVAAKLLGLF